MGFVKEFKEFAMRGNVMDMAIGIIIGGAFGKIVSSFVSDIIMPPIGMLLGGVDFKDLSVPLQKAADGTVTVAINYGLFINTVIDFVIIALAIFMVIKGLNRMKRKEEKKPSKKAEPTAEVKLLTEIRDSLKK
ncbi:MAG: large-conductance mechanosensitive channel protein MscL [Candidatus Altiarchaeota archaeon]|nr:large-conductance mechanosensitive channel protein MscL [Candidatus Altiarchaeota archaeon]